MVSTHSRLKAAGVEILNACIFGTVSTHSRLKAAGSENSGSDKRLGSFNTQPPEGGWDGVKKIEMASPLVSTHSRLKAAG